ncbi:MAG: acetyl/propionyl/methylcrotonyl-CoA carboxylase subunit alpha [Actinomycetia bacterium]|nr:acetyl/propionyl/methylcrotonyl-CoA carboxylase subunit alpha [Actinomycetes bacterium]
MFNKVLIANRGEIAVRVIRTLRKMGIKSVAIYSEADANALHVRLADEAVNVGPAPATESYLSIPNVIAAVVSTQAEAVHPGYGFLSENADFARACADAGVVFIGPPVAAIAAMADKIAAKNTVAAAGVPVVPGRHDPDMDDAAVLAAVAEVGYPALLKPSAGGGGKGMRLLREGDDVAASIVSCRREALSSFGDQTLLVERFVERPRHIEIQVLADNYGAVVYLGERECSLQRRHQKVIEEAPSPVVTPQLRQQMGVAAVEAARSCGYSGAGTVEFIVSSEDQSDFFFLEMNTRLQVEHPVTEEITGLDLVEQQLRVAAGESLALRQDEIVLTGHSIEARIYAENPRAGFMPSAGRLLLVAEPADAADQDSQIRVDTGVQTGDTISTHYDPMLAKIISHGADRAEAIQRLDRALADTAYLGIDTNVAYLRALLARPDVQAGDLHTGLLDEIAAQAQPTPQPTGSAQLCAVTMQRLLAQAENGGQGDLDARPVSRRPLGSPWESTSGWRLGEHEWIRSVLQPKDEDSLTTAVRGRPNNAEIRIGEDLAHHSRVSQTGPRLCLQVDDELHRFWFARDKNVVWLAADGHSHRITELDLLDAEAAGAADVGYGPVRSPMPGTVIDVNVTVGDQVGEAQVLVTVEAMKMEHAVKAVSAALVSGVPVQVGDQVALDDPLVVLSPIDGEATP